MARNLASAHPGKCPLFICFVKSGGELLYIETHEKFHVTPSWKLQQEVDALFGEDSYYAKADTTLPERPRRWEKKPSEGDG
jgi:hypothetical protein